MSFSDFSYLFLVLMFSIIALVGGCDRVRLSLLEDSEQYFRKRINDLELRIYRMELKNK